MTVIEIKLQNLGTRLRNERLRQNRTRTTFATCLGISVPTLRKMESGDPTVLIGYWARVLAILEREEDIDAILAEPEELLEKDEMGSAPVRSRASGKCDDELPRYVKANETII